jgi:two-component system CheB/CheR fusion protein
VPFECDGEPCAVTLRVSPAGELAPGYLLVVFQISAAAPGAEGAPPPAARPEPQPIVRQLEREIESMRVRLRDNSEQYEASNEELKASNEELQAMNEELRSATEELETSREELQSINEELTTVNLELKSKVDELAHANSDLHNLMNATAIATIFLDRDLRITRYTPTAVDIFNLILTDVGRPLADLKRHIDYPELEDDAARVIDQLVPIEREVGDHGKWFLARMLPYRTADDRIAGVVVTFVDVTARKFAEEELHSRNGELERFNKAAVGRELRMVDLKNEVNELLTEQGKEDRYRLESEEAEKPV